MEIIDRSTRVIFWSWRTDRSHSNTLFCTGLPKLLSAFRTRLRRRSSVMSYATIIFILLLDRVRPIGLLLPPNDPRKPECLAFDYSVHPEFRIWPSVAPTSWRTGIKYTNQVPFAERAPSHILQNRLRYFVAGGEIIEIHSMR